MQLPAPFGKYELLERIATGGMAQVFLARSFGVAGFQKELVIKRLRPELSDDPRMVQMFINEAKIGVHLNHPNVVQVYELGRAGGSHFIAMEHLHGRDLTRLARAARLRETPVPLPAAVAILAEACRGLAYAHARTAADGSRLGLVHRDVSPHNIVVTFVGEVKIVDFGVARLAPATSASEVPDTDRKPSPGAGKAAYMSPEQASGAPLDHRSDIFSAGVVLWELVAGRRLFVDADPERKLDRIRAAEVPRPDAKEGPIDDALWRILTTALARDPDDRYQSASLLEEDLRAWLFERRHRVERDEIAAVVRAAFPEEADRSVDDLRLHQLVADVERLDPADGTPSDARDRAESTALPGRLKAPAGERRPVVVAMVDVDGLTELSSRVAPEVLVKRKYQLLRWIRLVVDRYGGLVQRAVDDHVTLLFGLPRTRVDDSSHALQCALELIRRVGELRPKGMAVELAIGVHMGEVTVSHVGRRIRYVARGDTTRLARRLSGVADHGQVLVSDQIVAGLKGEFRARRGPGVPSRGGRPDLVSYLIEARSLALRGTRQGRWLRRGRELGVLREALVELTAGRGATVVLTGEVGTGKSRFLREIRDLAVRRGTQFLWARCSPRADQPLEPVRDLIAAVIGMDPASPVPALVTASERLSHLGLPEQDLEAVRILLGAAAPRASDPHAAWQALTSVLRGLATDRPLIVAFDEAHHLPEGATAALTRLVGSLRTFPVLLLLSTLPPAAPGLLKHGTELRLDPFDAPQQSRLVAGLLDVKQVGEGLLQFLARTCEGNPLYLEEMVKALVARARIAIADDAATLLDPENSDEEELPLSLQALITSRIDALEPAARGLLQLAAVAGPTFTLPMLAEAAGLDDPTPLGLHLLAHGLVQRGAGDEWVFASDLVREAVLRGTLGIQRRDYHRMIAAALETLNGDRLEPHLESLMIHCTEGGRPIDAARYAHQAGQALEHQGFVERARRCYRAGLENLARADRNPDEWDARIQGEATLNLCEGSAALKLGQTAEGRSRLQLALDIAGDTGLPWIEIRAHVALGVSYRAEGRANLAEAHLSQALVMLRTEDDPALEREALEASALLSFEQGRSADAEAQWLRAMHISQGDPIAEIRSQVGLANHHLRSGAYHKAKDLLESALTAARERDHLTLQRQVLNNLGLLHSWAGRPREAMQCHRNALELRTGTENKRGLVINHHNIGDLHFQNDDYARAGAAFARSRELAESAGWDRGVQYNESYLAYLDARAGRASCEPLVDAAMRASEFTEPEVGITAHWLAGRWMLENGREVEARSHLDIALASARRYNIRPLLDRVEHTLSQLGDATD